jgi:hypothetical protein
VLETWGAARTQRGAVRLAQDSILGRAGREPGRIIGWYCIVIKVRSCYDFAVGDRCS